jgi:hypothetical protein
VREAFALYHVLSAWLAGQMLSANPDLLSDAALGFAAVAIIIGASVRAFRFARRALNRS